MNRQWVLVLSVLALVVLAAPTSGGAPPAVQSPSAQATNETSLGTSVSSFMQVSSVEAAGEVDRQMFSAALANAPNESVRQRLLDRRAEHLAERLDDVEQSVEAADRGEGAQRTVDRSVAAARVDALERSVVDVGEFTNRTGSSPPGFEELRESVRGLAEPTASPVLDGGTDPDPPGNGEPGTSAAGGNGARPTQGASGQSNGSGDGASGSNPGEGASTSRNGSGAPTSGKGTGASNPGDGSGAAGSNPGDGGASSNGGGASAGQNGGGPGNGPSSVGTTTPDAASVPTDPGRQSNGSSEASNGSGPPADGGNQASDGAGN
ncbi:hypothetical protein ACFPYI_14340 [Halomarina salina]|uniref:DUF5667 domain-containing protein n=1 Tax=Halomarina salina TaxID=1872699 RepID=A0ABD5RPP6_9EURY|nr:hypothetical protein [Halomarina salina]